MLPADRGASHLRIIAMTGCRALLGACDIHICAESLHASIQIVMVRHRGEISNSQVYPTLFRLHSHGYLRLIAHNP